MSLPQIAQSGLSLPSGNERGGMLFAGELQVLFALIALAAHRRLMVEIGVADGATSVAILNEYPELESYIGIDCGPDYRTKVASQWTERPVEPGRLAKGDARFSLLMPARGSLDLTPKDFHGIDVDVVFIDGDHSAEVVRHDSSLARAITAPGGVIIWHDYQDEFVEVTGVLDADANAGYKIMHVQGTWLAFERR